MGHIIEKVGDLFSSDAPALAHGVNTKGAMGAGIALKFRERDEEMYQAYRTLCEKKELTPGGCMAWVVSDAQTTYNIASQEFPGPNAQLIHIGTGLFYALMDAEKRGYDRIAIPRIGCGIGGLEWEAVRSVIAGQVDQSSCDIEVWSPEE